MFRERVINQGQDDLVPITQQQGPKKVKSIILRSIAKRHLVFNIPNLYLLILNKKTR